MRKAKLTKSNLLAADLRGALLQEANLSEANLSEAKNLTIDQLAKVKTLYQAKLPPDLLKEVRAKYPHLLEELKPEPETKEKSK